MSGSNSTCHWIVCEDGSRWLPAVRRFSPQMLPAGLEVNLSQITTVDAGSVAEFSRGIVLWSFKSSELSGCLKFVMATKRASPSLVQFVAASGLTTQELLVFGEVGVSAVISHPEQLPQWSRALHRYFSIHF